MKNINFIILLICAFCISGTTSAQTTRSYAATSVMAPTGPQAVPTLAITIDFYNGYFLLNGVEKFVYRAKNYDGSMQYYPANPGNPALMTTGILVSGDYRVVRQFTQSSMMGMTMEIVYDYTYIGDGYEAAQNYMGTSSGSGYSEGSSSRDWADCSVCGGSGLCKHCGGTGRYEYSRDGRCGVCRGTGRCAGCDGKKGYYY